MAIGIDQPSIIIEVSFTTDPLATPSYTAISTYLLDEGFSIRRGRSDETGSVPAGRATLTLDNTDRRFDPEYTGGPYGVNVKPMKRIRISMVWSSVTYVVFAGYVENWQPDYDIRGRSICRVTCLDAFATFFARQNVGGEVLLRVCPPMPQIITNLTFFPSFDNTIVTILPLPQPVNRKLRAAFAGTVATASGIYITYSGTDTSGTLIAETLVLSGTNPSLITTAIFASLTRITIYAPFDNNVFAPSDIGAPLTLSIDSALPQEFSGNALATLLNAAGWPSGDRSIQNGKSLIQGYSVSGGSVLSYAQAITDTEGGVLFISRDGLLTFKNRHNRLILTTTATFGDGGGAELPYADAQLDYGERFIYNTVRLTRAGGAEQSVQDGPSSLAYFPRAYPSKSGLLQTTDNEVANQAAFYLGSSKDPRTRITSLRINGEASPSTLWPVLLAADLQQQYTVIRRPPGGGTITKTGVLESINFTMNSNTALEVEWGFSPSDAGQFWVLGTSALNSTTRLAY